MVQILTPCIKRNQHWRKLINFNICTQSIFHLPCSDDWADDVLVVSHPSSDDCAANVLVISFCCSMALPVQKSENIYPSCYDYNAMHVQYHKLLVTGSDLRLFLWFTVVSWPIWKGLYYGHRPHVNGSFSQPSSNNIHYSIIVNPPGHGTPHTLAKDSQDCISVFLLTL